MGQNKSIFEKIENAIYELNISELFTLFDDALKQYGTFDKFVQTWDYNTEYWRMQRPNMFDPRNCKYGLIEIIIKSNFNIGLKIFILNELIITYKFSISSYKSLAKICIDLGYYDIQLHEFLMMKGCKINRSIIDCLNVLNDEENRLINFYEYKTNKI